MDTYLMMQYECVTDVCMGACEQASVRVCVSVCVYMCVNVRVCE